MMGFRTLLIKELLRFWKVSFQTIAAPVLTALLYLLIFSHVLDAQVQVNGVRYTAFLIPGLVMMSVLQNAFANSSSSLDPVQSDRQHRLCSVTTDFAWRILRCLHDCRGVARVDGGAGVLAVTGWFAPLVFAAPH